MGIVLQIDDPCDRSLMRVEYVFSLPSHRIPEYDTTAAHVRPWCQVILVMGAHYRQHADVGVVLF